MPDGNEGGWIDYILARRIPERRTQVTAFELIRNTQSDESYSAHHGLLATVELSRPVEVAQLVALALLLMTATIARTSLSRRAWLKTMMLGLIRS